MPKTTRSISFPEEVLEEIDQIAKKWYADRSQTVVRIFQEWKRLKAESIPTPSTPTTPPKTMSTTQ